MGTFHVDVEIGDPEGRRYEPVEALVDTGATYTSLPRAFLEALGIVPHSRAWFRLADGHHVQREIGHARIKIGGNTTITIVVFADAESPVLLGAYALEGLLLAPDPVGRRLVPVPGLMMPLAPALT
jgi:aspartyl protease family protein